MNAYFHRWLVESRENCKQSDSVLPVDSLDGESRVFVKALQAFYSETSQATATKHFKEWAESIAKTDKDRKIVSLLYDAAMQVDVESPVYLSIHKSYKTRYMATEIAYLAEAYLNGHDNNALNEITSLLDEYKEVDEARIEAVTDDLSVILDSTVFEGGTNWRLECLNRSLGPLRTGDFVIVGARVETGKTTFLASESTHHVSQCEGPLLWINNEEEAHKVKFRLWQAALGVSADWIKTHRKEADEMLEPWRNKLIVVEPQFYWEVESLIQQYAPSLIVFDLLDKVEGFKADREDQMYSRLYRWARTLAKKHAPVITASQCDGEADGKKYMSMTRLDGSRTAKQKEADGIIMIGKDEDNEYMRYISLPKNKLAGGKDSEEQFRHGKFEVLIDPVRARYESL